MGTFYWDTEFDEDHNGSLNYLVKGNGGAWVSWKQFKHFEQYSQDRTPAELNRYFGIPEGEVQNVKFSIVASGTMKWAEGPRGRIPVSYLYACDEYGVIAKYRIRYSLDFDDEGHRTGAHPNTDRTELLWARESVEGLIDRQEAFEEIERARQLEREVSDYVGTVGERITVNVNVIKRIYIDNDWGGSFLCIMKDEDGNTLKWFASVGNKFVPEQGEEYTLRGKVKAHEEYNGEKGTILTRCKEVE